MSFIDLPIDLELIANLAAMKLAAPTPIQAQAIPVAMDGQDLLACAPTGTGKTLAFALPAVQHLLDTQTRQHLSDSPQVLILSPTRELAQQTQKVIQQLMQGSGLSNLLIVGGIPLGQQHAAITEQQQRNCLVATPGRLLELVERNWLDISQVQMLVIDEADRMLDLGFIDPINKVAKLVQRQHQTLMFSATLEGDKIQTFAGNLLHEQATTITIEAPRQLAGNIQHSIFQADNDEHKQQLIETLLQAKDINQAMVFVNSRKQVEKWLTIARQLGIRCTGLHGDIKQSARNQQIKDLRRGWNKMLITTDLACRGLDIPSLSHVINIYLPAKADTYVHRAGRSGREHDAGTVWSVVDAMDWPNLGRIERYLQQALPRTQIPGLEPQKAEPKIASKTKKSKAGRKKSAGKKSAGKQRSPTPAKQKTGSKAKTK
ncbi:MAG: DEAD/DEAH box helicase [Gammaproteobacteria bacterium]|jgi:ATP-dependent RNA helicase SrmB|nr:DEAD/DEAH box helicase [Gammaproteobacteria bacterium]